jgi:hypothetical protein
MEQPQLFSLISRNLPLALAFIPNEKGDGGSQPVRLRKELRQICTADSSGY